MQEQNDKELHDWVRQTLHAYRPGYNPKDWDRMNRKLRGNYWWRMGWASMVGVVGILLGWWIFTLQDKHTSEIPAIKVVDTHSPVSEKNIATPLIGPSLILADSALVEEEVVTPKSRSRKTSILSYLPLPGYHYDSIDLKMNVESMFPDFSVPVFSPEEPAIIHQMLTGEVGQDSTSYRTFSRNWHRWPNAVVICDLTTSMYPYSTQVFTWFRQHGRHRAIKGVVFFTDCDSLGQETQPNQHSGQMFVSRELDAKKALPVMLRAARNTLNNHQAAENDLEALVFAQQAFPEAQHLILLADNSSPVKDMELLEKITKPVHIVLCGTAADTTQAFHPDYFTIARQTKGTLHTIEDDLNPASLTANTWLRVGQHYYRYDPRKGKFKVTRFRHRPRPFMGLFWW